MYKNQSRISSWDRFATTKGKKGKASKLHHSKKNNKKKPWMKTYDS